VKKENAVTAKQLRSFGLLVGGIFAVIGLWPLVLRGENLRLWALILGGTLVGLGLIWPALLGPVFRVWMFIGHILGWINTRIILSLVFFLMITPMGLLMRLFGRDPMNRRLDPKVESYRVLRTPRPGSHMTRQF
jgi:hypothetical protein